MTMHVTPSIVRIAGPEDKKEAWRLLMQAHSDNGLFPLAPQKVEWFLNRALYPHCISPDDTGTRGVIGVIGAQGALEGLVFVTIEEYWYSTEKYLNEMLVYVDPACRKSNHAKALIEWMREQVKVTGLPLMTGIVTNKRTEAKCRLYQRMLPKAGEFYVVMPSSSASFASVTT